METSFLMIDIINIFLLFKHLEESNIDGTNYSRMDHFSFFKGCPPQILFGPLLPLLYSLKTSENRRFFRGYRSGTLVENGLIQPSVLKVSSTLAMTNGPGD